MLPAQPRRRILLTSWSSGRRNRKCLIPGSWTADRTKYEILRLASSATGPLIGITASCLMLRRSRLRKIGDNWLRHPRMLWERYYPPLSKATNRMPNTSSRVLRLNIRTSSQVRSALSTLLLSRETWKTWSTDTNFNTMPDILIIMKIFNFPFSSIY